MPNCSKKKIATYIYYVLKLCIRILYLFVYWIIFPFSDNRVWMNYFRVMHNWFRSQCPYKASLSRELILQKDIWQLVIMHDRNPIEIEKKPYIELIFSFYKLSTKLMIILVFDHVCAGFFFEITFRDSDDQGKLIEYRTTERFFLNFPLFYLQNEKIFWKCIMDSEFSYSRFHRIEDKRAENS